jgi:toxin FitB
VFLIDTNVLAEFRHLKTNRAHPAVAAWSARHDPETFWISVITLMETEIGIRRMERRDQHQGRILRDWLNGAVLPRFGARLLPVDDRIAALAAAFHVPDPAPVADSLIAATAVIHQLTLVTRNARDFAFTGVSLVNPWES